METESEHGAEPQHAYCRACEKVLPRSAFWPSAWRDIVAGRTRGERSCAECARSYRQRMRDARRKGVLPKPPSAPRISNSFSQKEVLWLKRAMHAMLCATTMHDLVRKPEYTQVARKVDAMADKAKRGNVVPIRSKVSR